MGQPVANVEVRLADGSFPHVRTDAAGTFGFSRLSLGYHGVRARARGWHRAGGGESVSHEAPFQFTTLTLLPAADVDVRVLDDKGSPIVGAEVMHSRTSTPGHFRRWPDDRFVTDAAGKVRLEDVALGDTAIHAWAPGFGVGSATCYVGDGAEVVVALTRTEAMRLRLVLGGATKEQIRAAKWQLYAMRDGHSAGCNLPPSLEAGGLADDGSVSICGLPLDMDLQQIGIVLPDDAVSPNSVALRSAKSSNQLTQELKFEVVPAEGFAVTGVVLDPEGKPLARMPIACRSYGVKARDLEARTDADGTFTFARVASAGEKFTLGSLDPRWVFDQPKDQEHNTIRYRRQFEGKVEKDGRCEVRCVAATEIRGRIVDPNDRGVAGVDVRLMTHRTPSASISFSWATSDRDGVFVLPRLNGTDGREAWIEAFSRSGDARSAPITMAVGKAIQLPDLRLEPPGVIEGVVRDSQGRVAFGATVRLQRPSSGETADETISDRDGRFRLVAGHGTYRLSCMRWHEREGDPRAETVELQSGPKREISLVRDRR